MVSWLATITAAALVSGQDRGKLLVPLDTMAIYGRKRISSKNIGNSDMSVQIVAVQCIGNLPKGKYYRYWKMQYCQYYKDFPVTNFGQMTSSSDQYPVVADRCYFMGDNSWSGCCFGISTFE
ncbi:hypothetical protein BDR04DRAFT_1114807 [Suillus decipiens]|nr:hypothetical protein BDR04DRAFT_1114807 [Suillus decipiens]